MNQEERRSYLIEELMKEYPADERVPVPVHSQEQKALLRGLMNVRAPKAISDAFLAVQDEYLQEEIKRKGIITVEDMSPAGGGLYLWRGDITRIAVDAIVNAANGGMTGCYVPNHACIDNCIHTYSGIRLRLACAQMMEEQGHSEPAGQAKITPAYNLPCRYVLHTVGPVVQGKVTKKDEELLASCYRTCLELAVQNGVKSIAFCCISTGVFHFPNEAAAQIAVREVMKFRSEGNDDIVVVFNVFLEKDWEIYKTELQIT